MTQTIRPTYVRFILIGLFLLAATLISSAQVSAISGSEFNAGKIIDDGIFFNGDALSVSQIQNFLNAKVPTCDTNGTQPYNGTTRAAYGASRGYPAPYTCLKDYKQAMPYRAPEDSLCSGITSSGSTKKTAAEIIYTVGQSCGVSQKVLIILLEKEQSLVTDDWPWSIQYRSATGYGCPDTAPCDAEYYGFFNQVYNAARIYKYYAKYPNSFNHIAGRHNYVLYNPNSSCGGSNVFIQNQATAGLYNYTPYQPNAAALNNLYGTGDSCSAYGNRNFWRIFIGWFGSTTTNGYSFVDGVSGSGTILRGDTKEVSLRIRNTSGVTWYADGSVPSGQNPTRLATLGFKNTPFADSADPRWLGTKNQVRMKESSVRSGSIATFEFTFKGPSYVVNNYKTQFRPIISGQLEYDFIGMAFTTTTPAPVYNFELQEVISPPPSTFTPGTTWLSIVKLKNTGTLPWTGEGSSNPVRLATKGYQPSPFSPAKGYESYWLGTRHTIKMKQSTIKPGQTGTFEVVFYSPLKKSDFTHNFIFTVTGKSQILSKSISINTSNGNPQYSYSFVSATRPPVIVSPNSSNLVTIRLRNTGNIVWRNESNKVVAHETTRVAMTKSLYRLSPFNTPSDSSWLGNGSQIAMSSGYVRPGEVAEFTATWTAPSTTGEYYEAFTPVIDGVKILQDKGMQFKFIVQ